MPAKQVLEIKTVSDGICIDNNICVCACMYILFHNFTKDFDLGLKLFFFANTL